MFPKHSWEISDYTVKDGHLIAIIKTDYVCKAPVSILCDNELNNISKCYFIN